MLLSTSLFLLMNLNLDDTYHWLHSHIQCIDRPTTINIKERMIMNSSRLVGLYILRVAQCRLQVAMPIINIIYTIIHQIWKTACKMQCSKG